MLLRGHCLFISVKLLDLVTGIKSKPLSERHAYLLSSKVYSVLFLRLAVCIRHHGYNAKWPFSLKWLLSLCRRKGQVLLVIYGTLLSPFTLLSSE